MAEAPEADVPVDHAVASRLVREQHPDLAGPLRLVASGWDNMVYRLGSDLAVRMPRRAAAVPLLLNEQRWLPVLAPVLPVPIPAPIRVGRPGAGYPYPWSVVPWMPGESALSVSAGERLPLAAPIAEFLIALHTPAPADAPVNPWRGRPLAERDAFYRERFASGGVPAADELLAIWERGLAAPVWPGPPVWVHGDMHPGNLLVDEVVPGVDAAGLDPAGSPVRLSAVIDFGDLTGGDPAADFVIAWLGFDASGRAAFREALAAAGHPAADDAGWARAHALAAGIASSLAITTSGDGPMARMARSAVAEVLAG
ncbi:aminoglycoside phosphotransferase family protein [Agromyces archimandritae]|uniref:Aminoglycoside phosphotransferase family protein n=1 Tax=Agromyces archimandritae TaxID=2781962 RepID=A0A975FJV1_9MICO|nr:aminoglycoside phosphotransferase family protein [Agromyces archimandritae]QTX03314.1 aminoglycoside phosphotransferase family protein [Agromyces archimandritae]